MKNIPGSGPYILASDIGGSHITAAVIDLKNHVLLPGTKIRAELNSRSSATHILGVWIEAFKHAMAFADVAVDGIALAMPGPFDYENGISYIKGLNKYDALYGMDIRGHLAAELGIEADKILFRNDAEAALAGEAVAGAGHGYNHVAGVTFGTGFGSACHRDNKTFDLNWGSFKFKESIADDYFSTRWFLKRYNELTGVSISSVKELAELDNETPLYVFKDFVANLNEFISTHWPALDSPQLFVLGGSIAKASKWFLNALKSKLPHINIALATLGDDAALFGACNLFEVYKNTVN